jgi:hypothetical protein
MTTSQNGSKRIAYLFSPDFWLSEHNPTLTPLLYDHVPIQSVPTDSAAGVAVSCQPLLEGQAIAS